MLINKMQVVLIGLFLLLLAMTVDASAQCRMGSGPDIGDGVPYCSQLAPMPPAPPSETHAALIWHTDAADVWVDGNYTGANNVGEAIALEACTKLMGHGCSSIGTWSNSSITIIRDKAGYFYKGWAGEDGLERKQAIADCSAKQLLPCEIFKTFGSGANRRFPGAGVHKSYAASAWVIGTVDQGYDNKLYVASGYRSSDEATAAAVKACGDATGRKCEANTLTGNGFIQTYRLGGTDDSATVETSAKRAKEAAQMNCKKQKATSCLLQAQFDSRKSGLFVHDFAIQKAP